MTNHINELIRTADIYTRGLTNDHVAVQIVASFDETYSAYARSGYNVGKGSRPMPIQTERMFERELLAEGEKPRGWSKIDILCEKVSLDESMRLAETEAKKRGFVLYLQTPKGDEIKWHPDGWEPQQG